MSSSLLLKTLEGEKGRVIVVVTADARTFRGVLIDCDESAVVLDDAVEGSVQNTDAWSTVTMGDAIAERIPAPTGSTVFQRHGSKRQWRLHRVLIRVSNVNRVWAVDAVLEPEKAKAAPKARNA